METIKNIHEIKYDAFISYKHNDFDSVIAERLQKKLERYHIPKVVQQMTGRKRIERVFRDKEELSLTSDLTKEIYEALDYAQFLIVICSPASKDSLWVQKEVSYYVNKHGKEHVITVLIDGEPETSFPEILCRDECDSAVLDDSPSIREPLAADVRALSLRKSIKQLDKEFLRLVATIIGCPYDGLKRRHRAYRMKCISVLSLIVIGILAGILSFTIYKNNQIFKYRQESFRRENEYLANQSMQALRSGNRADALYHALQMSALDESNTFQSPLQAYVLNNALYTYRSQFRKEYVPVSESGFDNIEKGIFSENGQYYYALTKLEYGENERAVYVFSGESGGYLYEIDSTTINKAIEALKEPFEQYMDLSGDEFEKASEQYFRFLGSSGEIIQQVIPYKGTIVLFIMNDAACLYDTASREILHCFLIPSGSVSQENYGAVYTLNSGDIYYFIKNRMGETFCYDISHQREVPSETFSKSGLFYMSENDNESTEIISRTIIDDNRQAVFIREKPEVEQKYAIDERDYYTYYPAVYDETNDSILWKGEKFTTASATSLGDLAGIQSFNLSNSDKLNEYIICWVNKRLILLNSDSGNTIAEITFDSNILSVDLSSDNSFMVGIESGLVQEVNITDDMILQNDRLRLSAKFSCVEYNNVVGTIAVISDGTVIFCRITGDSEMSLLNVGEEWNIKIDGIQYSESAKMAYRFIKSRKENKEELLVYPVLSDECIYHYIGERESSKIVNTQVISRNGKEILIVVEYNNDNNIISDIHEIDLDTGIELKNINIEYAEIAYYNDFVFTQDYTKIITISQEGKVVVLPLNTEKSMVNTYSALPKGVEIKAWGISTIENSVVFICNKSYDDSKTKELYMYHIGSDKAVKLDYTFSTQNILDVEMGFFTDLMAISFDNKIVVLDAASGLISNNIILPKTFEEEIRFSFFNKDKYLLVVVGKEVFLYEISSGNLLSSWEIDIVDEQTADLYDYWLVVDKSNTFFALKDSAFNAGYDGRWGKEPLIICFVDEECNIIPYANVNYGSVALNSGEIATNTNQYFQYAPLYDVENLRLRAEELLDEDVAK